jgi:predicted double-glycine peptidase/CRP-like cAMP-binding protein
MVQQHMSQLISQQQFEQIFHREIAPLDYQYCLNRGQLLNPDLGKLWTIDNITAGLYIIIAGKVRLLDDDDEPIASLGVGAYFGEYTLFPTEDLALYTARAGVNVQIWFLPQVVLNSFIDKYPSLRQQLWDTVRSRCSDSTTTISTLARFEPAIAESALVPVELPPNRSSQKISKAYFPNPVQTAGHLWQRVTRRYPYYAQQSASDCGAACLAMVARYWGKKFSINRLRDLAKVDRNGSSLKGLSAAAESIGFTTRPIKISLDRLATQPLPAIVHWQGKHYIVVYAVTDTQVIVADPAIGQRTLSHQEFLQHWVGYALILQPSALLKDAEEATTPFWQFFELLKPHRVVVMEIFIASLFIQIFGLITPLFTQVILDRVVVQKSELTLVTVGVGLFIFSMFRVAMMGLRQYLLDHTSNKLGLALIVAFIRHTMRLPLSFFESRYVGDIMSRVQENQKI